MDLLKRSSYAYELPQRLIAQTPSEKRDHARLLVLDRQSGKTEHKTFYDIIIIFSYVRQTAFRAVFYTAFNNSVITAAVSKIERTITKKAIELRSINSAVTGEKLTFIVTKEFIIFHFP